MSSTNRSYSFTSSDTHTVPDNAVNVNIRVRGARGGNGGNYGGFGGYGRGRSGEFTFLDDFEERSLDFTIGVVGSNGGSPGGGGGGSGGRTGGTGGNGSYSYQTSYSCPQGRGYARNCGGSCGCCGSDYCGGSQGNGDPCCGGALGTPNECFCCFSPQTCYNTVNVNTGGGGGGGGSTRVRLSGTVIIIGGGGAGGGGGASGGTGGTAGDWSTTVGTHTNGGNGSNRGSGGGTGGGGAGRSGGSAFGGGGSYYNSSYLSLNSGSSGTWDSTPDVRITYTELTPQITQFYGNPNPQYSSNATPQYTTKLVWAVSDFEYLVITGPGGYSYTTSSASGDVTIDLDQSDADGTSPTTHTYTLTAYAGSVTDTQTITVSAYNDNTPSNTWTTSFSNLESSTTYDNLKLGTLSGVDMPTTISVAGNGNFLGKGNGSFAGTLNFDNGDSVYLKTTSLYYNTDVSGQTGIYGKENSKTVTITHPGGDVDITITTRAPVIKEVFDYNDNANNYPYEDIDLISNTPTEYITSAQITMDDIELTQTDAALEIKSSLADTEVRINGGNWQSVREI